MPDLYVASVVSYPTYPLDNLQKYDSPSEISVRCARWIYPPCIGNAFLRGGIYNVPGNSLTDVNIREGRLSATWNFKNVPGVVFPIGSLYTVQNWNTNDPPPYALESLAPVTAQIGNAAVAARSLSVAAKISVPDSDDYAGALFDVRWKMSYRSYYGDYIGDAWFRAFYLSPIAQFASPVYDGSNWIFTVGSGRLGNHLPIIPYALADAPKNARDYVWDFKRHEQRSLYGDDGFWGTLSPTYQGYYNSEPLKNVSSFTAVQTARLDINGTIYTKSIDTNYGTATFTIPSPDMSLSYRPRAQVIDANGVKSAWQEIHVTPLPLFDLNTDNIPLLALDASPTIAPMGAPIVKYRWNKGRQYVPSDTVTAGSPGTAASPQETLDLSGVWSDSVSTTLGVFDDYTLANMGVFLAAYPGLSEDDFVFQTFTRNTALPIRVDTTHDGNGMMVVAQHGNGLTYVSARGSEKNTLRRLTSDVSGAKTPSVWCADVLENGLYVFAQQLTGTAAKIGPAGDWKVWQSRDVVKGRGHLVAMGTPAFDGSFTCGAACKLFCNGIGAIAVEKATKNLYYRQSFDKAATWSDAVLIDTLNTIAQLDVEQTLSGEIWVGDTTFSNPYISRDNGQTWPRENA